MSEHSIQVTIGGRSYSPTVSKEEVDQVLKAAGLINERIAAYEKAYAVKDKQDLLAMCCLQFATQQLEAEADKEIKTASVSEKIILLDKTISEHLNKEL
jgi:cell division protein ZapA (FtsZ GTPase activity inhibitor)